MALPTVKKLANERRKLRWEKEAARQKEREAHSALVRAIAAWRDTDADEIKLSNVACRKAPADLGCVYVMSTNPMRNPCVFCGNPEEDVF